MNAYWNFLTNEWYFAIPMFAMSFTGIALVIWRYLLNMNGSTKMDEFLPLFQKKLETEGVDGALRFSWCASTPHPDWPAMVRAVAPYLAGVRTP